MPHQDLARHLDRAHDAFLSTGATDPALRPVVVDSWRRSMAAGVDPETWLAPLRLDDAALAEVRAAHPLTAVMPVIRRLLVDSAAEAGLLVAVSDAVGQLLYVEGSHSLRGRAEAMNFVPGADWSEDAAGTNAPGTALALGVPVQISGAEHLARQVTPWSCSAHPIRDPDTGSMLGVLDVTGGADVVEARAVALVRATAAAAEAELRIARLSAQAPPATTWSVGWTAPRLEVLGKPGAVLSHGGATSRLSLRHSEIVLAIAASREGLSTGELSVALSDDEQAAVTVRAEISRLRQLLGPVELASRPYRFTTALRTDADDVRTAVRAGRLRTAVAAYAGPVLPTSAAPLISQLRDDLHLEVRAALLASSDADALLGFADTPHGRDDYELWAHALAVLPPSSPRRPQVTAHVARLDRELG
ncbi:GAF domain-containing protein [Nocardioides mangrovi]|uniref:Transcriptional regulator n=1 Tax=Nocardioides mangrovi TaxID=2874580 RepID=A0ABS7UI31_9ACTN|nr:GAF domain-containing protein [Nocardioides mangrovi]MBZ5740504.1 transcriptional regulator [Nocardioides mangrovi]